jgi:hypothetical protein
MQRHSFRESVATAAAIVHGHQTLVSFAFQGVLTPAALRGASRPSTLI